MKKTFLLVASLCLFIAASAAAQEPSEAEIQAFNLYKDAQTLMEQSRWDEAIETLDRASAAFAMPQISFQKARCLQARGDLVEAKAVLDAIATEDARLKAKIATLRTEIDTQLIQPIDIEVTSNAQQVKMIVDGRGIFFVPGRVQMTQGQHSIEYSAPGFRSRTEDRVIGQFDTALDIRMDEVGGKVILRTDLDSFWGMVVHIDDMELNPSGTSVTPNQASPIEIPAGTHTIRCTKAGYPDYTGTFTIVSTQLLQVECAMGGSAAAATVHRQSNPWKWVFLGVGGGMTAAGAGLMGWYFYNKANLPSGQVIQNDYYEGWIGLGLAGAGIAMAVMGFFIFPDREAPAATAGVTPSYGFALMPLDEGAAASVAVTF